MRVDRTMSTDEAVSAGSASPLISDAHSPPGRWFWLLMAGSLVGVGGVAYLQYARVAEARRERTRADAPKVYGEVPDFELVERSGRKVSLADLRGRVWVADFFFVNCSGPCPVMSRRMQHLQAELLRDRMDKVLCVSFSVDPDNDTPAALREYAEQRYADPQRWLFLTGDRKTLRRLAGEGFRLGAEEAADDPDRIMHSTRFVLVDRKGRIRGYYRAMSQEEEEDPGPAMERPMDDGEKRRLMRDIRSLLIEGSR